MYATRLQVWVYTKVPVYRVAVDKDFRPVASQLELIV